jgi:hypothetical protein
MQRKHNKNNSYKKLNQQHKNIQFTTTETNNQHILAYKYKTDKAIQK